MAAFTSAVVGKSALRDKNVKWGTFASSGGATGGDINTGLTQCDFLIPITGGAAVSADQCSVNETFPVAGNAVTIVTTANVTGHWIAIGR